jgi:hypothetical protein
MKVFKCGNYYVIVKNGLYMARTYSKDMQRVVRWTPEYDEAWKTQFERVAKWMMREVES